MATDVENKIACPSCRVAPPFAIRASGNAEAPRAGSWVICACGAVLRITADSAAARLATSDDLMDLPPMDAVKLLAMILIVQESRGPTV